MHVPPALAVPGILLTIAVLMWFLCVHLEHRRRQSRWLRYRDHEAYSASSTSSAADPRDSAGQKTKVLAENIVQRDDEVLFMVTPSTPHAYVNSRRPEDE